MDILNDHSPKDGTITFHRDNLDNMFTTQYDKFLCCIPFHKTVRFTLFVVFFLSGLSVFTMLFPVSGLLKDTPSYVGVVYVVAKVLLYTSQVFLASPLKQMLLVCRPVRFSTVAFTVIGIVGVWLTLVGMTDSIALFILSLIIQSVSISFYTLSYLSFTRNVLFDCIKRPHIIVIDDSIKQESDDVSSTTTEGSVEIPME